MTRRLSVILVVFSVLVIGSMADAQRSGRSIPMSGAVVNAQALPVDGATVVLLRRATSARGDEAEAIVAQGRTDQQGLFSFGNVALETAIAFPLETAARFEYVVKHGEASLEVADVTFTVPRSNGEITAVAARISLK